MTERRPDDDAPDSPSVELQGNVLGPKSVIDTDRESRNTHEPEDSRKSLEELQSMCVCEGKWVESLAAISTPVRNAHYDYYDDELWLMATWTDLEVLFEWRLRGKLYDGDLVRVADLPEAVEVPEYVQPTNHSQSSEEDSERMDRIGDNEGEQ